MSTHLPFDIQVQIIERLPIKSFIRFRSVCKAWNSFIGSSRFIASYDVRHHQSEHLLVRYAVGHGEGTDEVKSVCFVDDDTFPQQKLALTIPPLVQGLTEVLGNSHGLLCMIGSFGQPDDFPDKKLAILWNPAIRKSIAVIVPYVACWPFNSVVGFGVCPDTKDPKLVNVAYIKRYMYVEGISCIPFQVMVFTLSSGEWTTSCSNQLPRKSIQFDDSYQTTIGYFIYWLAWDMIKEDVGLHNLIMSFDLRTDEFREVDVPDSLRQSKLAISKLRESLVLLDYDRNFTTKKLVCDVWMMEHGDSKAFTKLFTVNAPVAWTILGFRNSGEPIVEMREDEMDPTSALAVYEPCLEDIKDLGICGYNYSFHGSSYTESLLLLDHDDGRIITS